jgi:hypothetical protein
MENESDRILGEEGAFLFALSTACCKPWPRYERGGILHRYKSHASYSNNSMQLRKTKMLLNNIA